MIIDKRLCECDPKNREFVKVTVEIHSGPDRSIVVRSVYVLLLLLALASHHLSHQLHTVQVITWKVLQRPVAIGVQENVLEKSTPHIDGKTACGTLPSSNFV